jgi:hypothetical protein
MICTVSTVKDGPENIQAFVNRNLAAGVDHMFVFLDAPNPDANEWLKSNEHVTSVRTGGTYWAGRRPELLNRRQTVNANLINVLLAPFEDVAWLFHIDGDECLDVDLGVLAAFDPATPSVRLRALEAVSRRVWPVEVDYFKRKLDLSDLHLLHTLGIIPEPTNRAYFNGHVVGKAGIRPSPAVRVGIHVGRDHKGREIASRQDDALNLLHYESYCEEEFIRKWEVHLTSGGGRFRAQKDQLRGAVKAIVRNANLSDDGKHAYLAEIYRRHVEDDFETLRDLGMLVHLDRQAHSHPPAAFSPEDARGIEVLLSRVQVADKAYFAGPGSASPAQLMASIRSDLPLADRRLAELIGESLARTKQPPLAPPRQPRESQRDGRGNAGGRRGNGDRGGGRATARKGGWRSRVRAIQRAAITRRVHSE